MDEIEARKLFKELRLNKDGSLNHEDIAKAFEKLNVPVTKVRQFEFIWVVKCASETQIDIWIGSLTLR